MQPLDKPVYECRFSRADFTDERDKTFTVLNAIHQPAQRFFNLPGKKEVARIWIYVERIVFQPEVAFVHGVSSLPARRYSASIPLVILSLLCGLEILDPRPAQDNFCAISTPVVSCATEK